MFYKSFTLIIAFMAALALSHPVRADLIDAQSLYEQGQTREAMAEVDRLLSANPGDPQLRFLKGIIFAEEGRNDAAIEVFAGLTQDYPDLPEPYNNLAVLFAEKGEFEKARDSLLSAIQTHPSYSTAHENLGDLYAKMAGMSYNRALEEDRANESARIKLSAVNGLFTVPQRAAVASAEPPRSAPATQAAAEQPPAQPATSSPPPVSEPVTVAAAQTTPVASRPGSSGTTSAPVADPGRDQDAIIAVVESWRSAWTAQDVSRYVESYTPSYSPTRNLSHAGWLQQRRQRLGAPSFIDVQIDDLQIQFIDDANAQATFVQTYRSDSYEDRVRKTLTLTLTDSGWRIERERSDAI